MHRYTVGVAGNTVNVLPSGSGGSTPSRCTIFGTYSLKNSLGPMFVATDIGI